MIVSLRLQVIVIITSVMAFFILSGLLILCFDFSFTKQSAKVVPRERRTIKNFFRDVLPDEFTSYPWYVKFWNRLLAKHKYICFLSPRYGTVKRKAVRVIMVVGRLVNMIFLDTILSALADDNGVCDSFTTKTTCLQPASLDLQNRLCTWDPDWLTCSYNDHGSTFLASLVITLVTVIGCVPLDAFVEYTASHCSINTSKRLTDSTVGEKNVRTAVAVSGNSDYQLVQKKDKGEDEFRDMQTLKFKMMLAVRLVMMRARIDHVTPARELERMLIGVEGSVRSTVTLEAHLALLALKNSPFGQKYVQVLQSQSTSSLAGNLELYPGESSHASSRRLTAGGGSLSRRHVGAGGQAEHSTLRVGDNAEPGSRRAGFSAIENRRAVGSKAKIVPNDIHKKIVKKIKTSRQKTKTLIEDIRQLATDELRESYLFKVFLAESLTGYKHAVATKYFFDYEELDSDDRKRFVKAISVIVLPSYLLFCLFYIFLYGIQLGPAATNLWLISLAIDISQDVIFLQPLLVLINFTLLSFAIKDEVEQVHALIVKRVRFLMRRTRGVLSNQSELLQHFNPACRAARRFPHLMVSRLLISLKDYDFPTSITLNSLRRRKSNTMLKVFFVVLGAVGTALVILLAFLPGILQETMMNLLVSGAFEYAFITIAKLDTTTLILLLVAVIFIIVAIFVYELYLYRKMGAIHRQMDQEESVKEVVEANAYLPSMVQPDSTVAKSHSKRSGKGDRSLMKVHPQEGTAVMVEPVEEDPSISKVVPFDSDAKVHPMGGESFVAGGGRETEGKLKKRKKKIRKAMNADSAQEEREVRIHRMLESASVDSTVKVEDKVIPVVNGPPEPTQPEEMARRRQRVLDKLDRMDKRMERRRKGKFSGDELSEDETFNIIGGRLPRMEGPGARARRSMEAERLADMGRTPDMDPGEKTVREIVSANPFETNYTLEDVFAAVSKEMDRDLRAFEEVKKSRMRSLSSSVPRPPTRG